MSWILYTNPKPLWISIEIRKQSDIFAISLRPKRHILIYVHTSISFPASYTIISGVKKDWDKNGETFIKFNDICTIYNSQIHKHIKRNF